MEDLSYSNHLQHEAVSLIDDDASANTEGRAHWAVSVSPPAFRAVSLLDSLSPYAAVFGCSADCQA